MKIDTLDPATKARPVTVREFLGRRSESEETYAQLPPDSQAALRQFSVERLLGYGVAPADVVELRAAMIEGAAWEPAARRLAEIALETASAAATPATRITCLRRASALLRMSQVMMDTDTEERRAIFTRAAALFGEAAKLAADRERVVFKTDVGALVAWLRPAAGRAVGSAIVIGGVEGWAMDFESLGQALVERGVDTLMLDGPGQGESRFAYGHYLTADWRAAYSGVIDVLTRRTPNLPLAFVGNSLGGTFAMAMAAADPRIRACVSNCGIVRTGTEPPTKGPNFSKMLAFCGTADVRAAAPVWATMDPLTPVHGADFPLLIVQGGRDPAVPLAVAEMILERAPTGDKQMTVFSDGDHCIYNHSDDRDALIADWVHARLVA